MPARALGLEGGELGVPHRLEKGTSANKDAMMLTPKEWIVRFHIGRRTKHSLYGHENISLAYSI